MGRRGLHSRKNILSYSFNTSPKRPWEGEERAQEKQSYMEDRAACTQLLCPRGLGEEKGGQKSTRKEG